MVMQDKVVGALWDASKGVLEMDDDQYARWRELLEQRTGMILPDERRSFLLTNLAIRMREIGCHDFQEYYEHVLNGPRGAIEWTTLVDRLTVHETRFFRHFSSLIFLKEKMLPEWIKQPGKSLNIWSVGCATGEEPYTLAMVIDYFIRQKGIEYYLGVLASDISMASLAIGREGVYDARKLTEMEAAVLRQYMTRVDEGRYQVNDALKKRVCFMRLNVLEMDNIPIGKMDLIFCQNLLIYFNRQKRLQILNNLVEHLVPGGYLILGSGEIINWDNDVLEKIYYENTLVYRRVGNRLDDDGGNV